MLSLHDHHVRAFAVDADAKTLRFCTAYPGVGGPGRAEGLFEGVEGYVIAGDALGTILLGVTEVDPLALYDAFAGSMRDTYHQHGGHASWVRERATAEEFLRRGGVAGYSVTSSIGFTGAVWARSFRVASG